MAKLNLDSNLIIKGEDYLIDDVVDKLIYLPSDQVVTFFNTIGLNIPRLIRIDVLKNVLREPVKELRNEKVTLADEINYRLLWFNRFTEFQLESLLDFFKSNTLNELYLRELWKELINYLVLKQVNDDDILNLILTAKQMPKTLPSDILAYNLELKSIFFDEKGEIDGVKPEDFRPILFRSSTLVELRTLGLKYGVNVPRRLKKEELSSIILDNLSERDELTPELEAEIAKMSIVQIQRFAKNNDIKASIELKKEEIIEYILSNATETKETYYKPSSENVYNQEIVDEVLTETLETEEVIEQVIPAPIIKEVIRVPKVEKESEVLVDLTPIIINTAQFNSNEKYYKEDINELKENIKIDKKAAKIAKQNEVDSNQGDFIKFISWMIVFVLLAIIIVVLVDLFSK